MCPVSVVIVIRIVSLVRRRKTIAGGQLSFYLRELHFFV
nr:MAG TPA: hypothetical protein [Caudoviricetes sp.]